MRKNNHYEQTSDKVYIEISANTNTLKSEIIIIDKCEVDFRRYNSIKSLQGFELYTSWFNESENTVNESENTVNILTINSTLVNIDIISGSFVNGSTQPTIYSFFQMSLPGIKLSKFLISFSTPHNCKHHT